MKRALLLAFAAAAAMLLPTLPVAAQSSPESSGVVRASHRRSPHRYHRPYWGWGASFWWGPYGYYPRPYYSGYYGRPYGYAPSPDWAAIDTDVSPEGAYVYLDGTYVGVADDFDGYPDFLYLKRGHYRLEFRLPGYETKSLEIQSRPGMKLSINEDLPKIPGAKQYGSYDEPPRPEGGVRRFWGKRRNVAESIEDDEEIYGRQRDRDRYDDDDDEEADREDEEDEDEAERPRERSDARSEEWRGGRRETPSESAREETRLRVRVEPADAVVFLDDRFVGTAQEIVSLSRGVSVTPGKHSVTVSRPGYKDSTVQVEVGEGETEELTVTLRR